MGGPVNNVPNNANGIGRASHGHPHRSYTSTNESIAQSQTGIGPTNGSPSVTRGSIGASQGWTGQAQGAVQPSSPTPALIEALARMPISEHFPRDPIVPPAPPSSPVATIVQSNSSLNDVIHSGNHRQVGSYQAQGGLPQSHSYQVMSTYQHLLSPGPTPQHLGGASGHTLFASPGTSGRLTEPRNYAPRTSGQPIVNAPPPKFGLDLTHSSPSSSVYDPFTSSPANRPIVPYYAGGAIASSISQDYTGGAIASSISQGSSVQGQALSIEPQRSSQLNELTNTPSGYPSINVAMDPANFPFVDGPRQGKPQNFGVVKLKNVRFLISLHGVHPRL